jgi:hypothetical protein
MNKSFPEARVKVPPVSLKAVQFIPDRVIGTF